MRNKEVLRDGCQSRTNGESNGNRLIYIDSHQGCRTGILGHS